VGDISPAFQVRLLRVLQDKTYEPLGSTKSEAADVRIVAASNKDLARLVEEGKFREDLYYRINVVKLELPPLRERKGDIPLLIEYFITKFNQLNSKEIQGVSPEVMPTLMSLDFPGNIRELENIIEYATVVCKENLIGIEHLPDYLRQGSHAIEGRHARKTREENVSWDGMEKSFIYDMLMKNNWNRKETAAQLGIHPTTLWRKIKHLKIAIPKQDGRTKTL
jgi:transcriptional regulator with PAS, ATPase and Fis domain